MHLLTFTAKNFKNLKDLSLNLDYKTVLISGNPGNGKTAVLSGIIYLLTDKLPKDTTLSDWVRWGEKDFSISLSFNHAGKNYLIETTGGTTPTQKKLTINGKEKYTGKDVYSVLGSVINPILFKYSSVAEQGDTSALILDKPQERLSKLKSIAGFDDLGPVIDALDQDLRETQKKRSDLVTEKQLIDLKKYNFLDVPVLEELGNLKDRYNVLQEKKIIYEQQFQKYQHYLDQKVIYEKNQILLSNLTKQIDDLKIQLNSLVLIDLPFFDYSVYDSLENKIAFEEKAYIEYKHALDFYQTNIKLKDNLEQQILSCEKEKELYPIFRLSVSKYTATDLDDLKYKLFQIDSEIKEINNLLTLGDEGICPTCGQSYIFDSQKLNQDLIQKNDERNTLLNQQKLISEELTKIKEEQEKLDQNIQKRNLFETLIEEKTKQLNNLIINKPEEKEFPIEELKKEKKILKETLQQIESIKEKNNQTQLKQVELTEKINQKQEQIKELSLLPIPVSISEPESFNNSAFKKIEDKLLLYKQIEDERDRTLDFNNKIQTEKNQDKLKSEELFKDIESLTFIETTLRTTKDVLNKQFSSFLIDEGARIIKDNMNAFFNKAYGKYNITFKQEKNSIEFYYQDRDHKIPTPVTMASGFEKDVIAVANRIALGQLQNLGVFLFDEIDSQAGDESSFKLMSLLLESYPLNQFFIITHNESTKEMLETFPNAIEYRLIEGAVF